MSPGFFVQGLYSVTFRSRVDGWIAALLIAGGLVALGGASLAVLEAPPLDALAVLAVTLGGQGIVLWLVLSIRYVVEAGVLHVHAGPFHHRIPLSSIHSVHPSRNPISSPAMSLDRLEIRYGNGRRILVSPRDRAAFLRAIGQGSSPGGEYPGKH